MNSSFWAISPIDGGYSLECIVVFGSSIPSTTKKETLSKVDPLCQNVLDPRSMICPDETCQVHKKTIQNTLITSLGFILRFLRHIVY